MPCPNGVDIAGNFTALNLLKVHGLPELTQKTYEELGEGKAKNCKDASNVRVSVSSILILKIDRGR